MADKHSETTRRHLPDAAAVYCLLGKLWHAHDDVKKAVDYYVEALKLNPFMWDAFLGLCHTGANIRIPNIFKMTPEMLAVLSASSPPEAPSLDILEESPPNNGPLQPQPQPNNNPPLPAQANNDPFSISSSNANGASSLNFGSSGLFRKFNQSSTSTSDLNPPNAGAAGVDVEGMETPTALSGTPLTEAMIDGITARAMASANTSDVPQAPMRKMRPLHGLAMDFGVEAPPKMRTASAMIKSRVRGDSELQPESALWRTSSTAPPQAAASAAGAGDRKRTVSGQVAQTSSSQLNDPTAAPQRRSVRLFNQIRPTSSKMASSVGSLGLREGRELKKAKATGTKGRTGSSTTVGRVVSGNRKYVDNMEIDLKDGRVVPVINGVPSGPQKHVPTESAKEEDAVQGLLDLFMKLGSGYFALTHYQCQDALQIFASVALPQRETPWVMAQIGRAHYEQASYAEAEKYFSKVRKVASSRMEDMEVYSTILWHLKNEVELAYLSHELIEGDRLSPQAWCAAGNSFSLQREHDQALKCFKRATQLDPKFAYAFTLQGHEHVANEEYEKAQAAYRSGIAAENRHYNAWYGLGKVYEKMGKYEIAEKHFRTAAAINPTNAVLICCIGMVLEKMKTPKAALLQYTKACDLAPRSELSRFKKARVLMALQEPHMALTELRILKDIAPDEANVHFLLGRLYKTLHQKASAIKHFTTALNLDPKAAQYIKDAMESLEDDEEEDEEQMS
ncbi:MAG: anaphase-promoting complex subunit cdc27 [Pycnora praestabilis]|nr:MAG: anaphase-promoting complex subunit cdc27 [Pycnora praestabilis]